MEEHFILRVPQSVAERLERILNENPASASDEFLDLAFQGQLLLIAAPDDSSPKPLASFFSHASYSCNLLLVHHRPFV